MAGHIALDILPDMSALTPAQVVSAGKVFEIGRISYSTGGAVSNTGLALHQLGVDVELLAAVGDDWVGRAIIDYVRGFGVELGDNIQIVAGAASPYTIVIEPAHHDRTLLTHTGVYNDYDLGKLDLKKIAQAPSSFISAIRRSCRGCSRTTARASSSCCSAVKDTGAVISIDMSLPPPDSPSGRADWRKILRSLPALRGYLRAQH